MNESNSFEYGPQDINELTITSTLEDDTELVCGVVAIFTARDKDYIALIPLDVEDPEVFLYRFIKTANGDPILESIEDDEEFELAANAYDAIEDDGYDINDRTIDDTDVLDYDD